MTATVEETKAALREEFPRWSIIHSSAGRWWAMRDVERDERGRLIMHEVSDVDADTADQLRGKLRAVNHG
ncbi:hypothetical protein [Actinomadura sp. 3N407]|uniref:hypothetical protein n=1 Tax=Actinomadura sp. 3N407 TaxID=3457423 RepID=UPI003FCCD67F